MCCLLLVQVHHVPFAMSKRSSSTSTVEYVERRKLDVIGDYTGLNNHQFAITGLSRRLDRNREIMWSQQVSRGAALPR